MKIKVTQKEYEFVMLLLRNYAYSTFPETVHATKNKDMAKEIVKRTVQKELAKQDYRQEL